MRTKFLVTTLAAVAGAMTLAACDRESMDRADATGAQVGRKANETLQITKEKLAQAGRKAEASLAEAGQETRRAVDGDTGRDARGVLSDAAITASIKTDLLKDPDLSALKIDVDTHDGVVTLNGLADDDAARTRAEHIAGNVKGVKEVRNHLVVKKA